MTVRPTTVTLTLMQDRYGNISAATDLAAPRIGKPLDAIQSLALQITSQLHHCSIPVSHGAQHVPALTLLAEIAHPEGYGWSAPRELLSSIQELLRASQKSNA